jgi:hypothetical protein
MIDLGRAAQIARMELDFETAFAKGYKIELMGSATGNEDWTTVFTTKDGSGTPSAKQHVLHDVDVLGKRQRAPIGRWIRVTVTELGTAWGVSLWEVRVYGWFM